MLKKILNWLHPNKKPVFSFRQGFDLTEMPVITLYQGEKKFNFLLDTGSNNNILDKEALKEVEHSPTEYNSQVTGVEGNVRKDPVHEVTFTYEDKEFPFYYVISDLSGVFSAIKKASGVTLHGMLGSKFFNAYKYVLDFHKLIAYIK